MADASQQAKERGRYGPGPGGATPRLMRGVGRFVQVIDLKAVPPERDVGAALAALSEEDLLRLRAIARLRARSLPDGMSWSDLLHEAVLRALTGARPWPPGVSLLAFLAGVMRSIGDEQWRRHRRQHDLPAPGDGGEAHDPERARQRRPSPRFSSCSRPTMQH
jgi:DNA-directed RNA polymerase specialized sigma24 family protein